MTLLHMATQQPQRVEAMVLFCATIYYPEQARAIVRAQTHGERSRPNAWPGCAGFMRGATPRSRPWSSSSRFEDSYDDMNFTSPYLGTITARTLIVHGDRDEFFPVDIAVEMYHAIPHSALMDRAADGPWRCDRQGGGGDAGVRVPAPGAALPPSGV